MSDAGSTVPTSNLHDVNSEEGSAANVAKADYRMTNGACSTRIPADKWNFTREGSIVTAIPTEAFRTANNLGSTPGSSAGKHRNGGRPGIPPALNSSRLYHEFSILGVSSEQFEPRYTNDLSVLACHGGQASLNIAFGARYCVRLVSLRHTTRRSTLAAQFNFPNVLNFPTFSSLISSPPLYTSTCSSSDSNNNSGNGMSATDTASALESLQSLIDPSLRHLIPGDTTGDIDASGSLLGSHLTSDVPIDPSLFDLERVVNDARTGKLSSQPLGPDDGMIAPINPHTQPIGVEHTVHSQQDTGHIEPQQQQETADIEAQGEDEEIDPALREIVNSLTNAQQSAQSGPGLTHAQAAAAIGAHLADTEERERLQQSLQTTLDDFASENFGALFPPGFPHSPAPGSFLLPQSAEGEPSTSAAGAAAPQLHIAQGLGQDNTADAHAHSGRGSREGSQASGIANDTPLIPEKRGRGRPKGSRNKNKAEPKPRKRTKKVKEVAPEPKRPRGRPPKIRSEADQAEFDQRKQEKQLGIKRTKGRPRKFPGYLVREMRLKKNRAEFNELLKRYRENPEQYPDFNESREREERGIDLADIHMLGDLDGSQGEGEDGEHGHSEHGQEGEGSGHSADAFDGWPSADQSLLDAVGAANLHHDDGEHGDHASLNLEVQAALGHVSRELGQGEDGLREVFGIRED